MDISLRINRLRKEKKISLVELAEKVGFTYVGLQKALKNNDFRISQLSKIAEVLETPISSFFSEFDEKMKIFLSVIEKNKLGYYLWLYIDRENEKFVSIAMLNQFNALFGEDFDYNSVPNLKKIFNSVKNGSSGKKSKIFQVDEKKMNQEINSVNPEILIKMANNEIFNIPQINLDFYQYIFENEVIKFVLEKNLISHSELSSIIGSVVYSQPM